MPSLFLCQLTEVSERNVAFLPLVKIFENGINLVHLILNSEVIQSFLELIERYSVVEVHVEVSICLSHSFESFIDLDPEQVQDSL